jgi:amidase
MRRLTLAALVVAALHAVPAGAAPGDIVADRDCLRTFHGLDLQRVTIPELQQAMASGEFTSAELVGRYLTRIDAYRASNAIRAINPHAQAIARELDEERADGFVRGPLHGIPVLLKDNVGTTDMPTTAGSIALENWIPTADAVLTQKLREAGAVILGKTNLSEFANWMATGMPNGFSTLGGQVHNAYDGGDPSGSSSGSGVAASLALAAATIGTETSGSILSPSLASSDVGLKTTRGIVSRTGIIPLAERFDVPGPIVRNVTDAAVMLSAIAGHDTDDHATDAIPPSIAGGHDFTADLDGDLTGLTFAYDGSDPSPMQTAYAKALQALKDHGATLVDTGGFGDEATAYSLTELPDIFPQFHAGLDHYLQTTPHQERGVQIGSLGDIVAYNTVHADKVPYGQDKLIESFAAPGVDALGEALSDQTVALSHQAIEDLLDSASAVAFVSPDAPYIGLGAAAGHPTIVVPMGRPGGSNASIGFLGRRFAEPEILDAARVAERAAGRRVLPTQVEGGAAPAYC